LVGGRVFDFLSVVFVIRSATNPVYGLKEAKSNVL